MILGHELRLAALMDEKGKPFRKKPVVVQAFQVKEQLAIKTLEGMMTASPGDWIIQGIKGEFYPCKPDIFEVTYEEARDAQDEKG